MPSGFGWSFIGIAMSLFILGSNLQSNAILLLCYFLIAMMLLGVFHSFFYFTQHKISFSPVQADFENRTFQLPILVNSSQNYVGGSLQFTIQANANHAATTKLDVETYLLDITGQSTIFKLSLPPFRRGIYACPQVKLSTRYGFGLFKCWTHLTPNQNIVVYPSMKKSTMVLQRMSTDKEFAQSSDSQYAISDNLQGIREYQTSDSLRHVSWKHAAKGLGMLTKDFKENVSLRMWLSLDDFSHLDKEEALQSMCYLIQQLDKDHVQFGLDLGINQVLPNQGTQHLLDCLYQLAIYPRSEQQGMPT